MSKLFAIAVPIIPGKEEAWRDWMNDLRGKYRKDFENSRKEMGVHERTFLQHTPMGDFVIVTLEGDDPQSAFTKFGQGDSEFVRWFMNGVKDVHGIDLSAPGEAPLPELVMDSKPQPVAAFN